MQRIEDKLIDQKKENLYRKPYIIEETDNIKVKIDEKWVTNFCSNDYLGIASNHKFAKILKKIVRKNGVGSGSSRLIAANRKELLEAEKFYANYFGYENALFFTSGYQANIALISTLFKKGDHIFFDKEIHASSINGMKLSLAKFSSFKHNDFSHLKKRLGKSNTTGLKAILVEGCYSMSGDIPDFSKVKSIAKDFKAITIVDEAHSIGVLGKAGKGSAYPFKPDIMVGTLGKAFGFFGAFLLMSNKMKEYFFNFSSPLIYTTALPPFFSPYVSTLLKKIEGMNNERARLKELSQFFHSELHKKGIKASGSEHIITIQIGSEAETVRISQELLAEGFLIAPIRFPTVSYGKAILRIGLTVNHTKKIITALVECLKTKI